MANRTIWTPEKEGKFHQKLIDTGGNVSAACRAVKVPRSTAYEHKKQNQTFSDAWDEAIEHGTDELEAEARRRAFKGTTKPVFYRGGVCGEIQEYSDTLMIFLLKGNRPEKYKERHEHSGADNGPIPIVQMTLKEWNKQAANRIKAAGQLLKNFE